jgi:transcriptional regulator with XRE-family HTH domain
MRDKDVIGHIKELCAERSWSYYKLAAEANIPYSTLNNMLHRSNIPTIPTLQKICDGMGISLSDFFADDPKEANLTKSQNEILELFSNLQHNDKQLLVAYAKGLNHVK